MDYSNFNLPKQPLFSKRLKQKEEKKEIAGELKETNKKETEDSSPKENDTIKASMKLNEYLDKMGLQQLSLSGIVISKADDPKLTPNNVLDLYKETKNLNKDFGNLTSLCARLATDEEKLAEIEKFLKTHNIHNVSAEEVLGAINGLNNNDPIEVDFASYSAVLDKIKNSVVEDFAKKFNLDAETTKKLEDLIRRGADPIEIGKLLGFTEYDMFSV